MRKRMRAWIVVTEDNNGEIDVRRVLSQTANNAEMRVRDYVARVYDFAPEHQVARVLHTVADATLHKYTV